VTRLGAPIALKLGPDAREMRTAPDPYEREPDHVLFFVSGFGSGAYSAKLLAGIKQRFYGFSHIRQCGELVLRMFVSPAHQAACRWITPSASSFADVVLLQSRCCASADALTVAGFSGSRSRDRLSDEDGLGHQRRSCFVAVGILRLQHG